MVVARQVAGRTLAPAIERVKLGRLHDEAEAFQLAQLDRHVLAAAGPTRRPTGPAIGPSGGRAGRQQGRLRAEEE